MTIKTGDKIKLVYGTTLHEFTVYKITQESDTVWFSLSLGEGVTKLTMVQSADSLKKEIELAKTYKEIDSYDL